MVRGFMVHGPRYFRFLWTERDAEREELCSARAKLKVRRKEEQTLPTCPGWLPVPGGRLTGGAGCCLVLLAICVSGCSGKHPIKIATPPTIDAVSTWVSAVNAAFSENITGPPNTPIEKRNRALSYSEALVMARYGEVRKNLIQGRTITEISLDVLNLGLAAGVPIVNGARGKTILGALATGFLGVQSSVDKNLFQQQTTAALLSAMDACIMRQRKILDGHRSSPVSEYDEFDAYVDLVGLYGCTTLPGAIQELTETQAAATQQTKKLEAPVSKETLAQFQAISSAFAASAKSDKAAAIQFLQLLGVDGISNASTESDLFAGYATLGLQATAEDFRKKMVDAAKRSGLIPEDKS